MSMSMGSSIMWFCRARTIPRARDYRVILLDYNMLWLRSKLLWALGVRGLHGLELRFRIWVPRSVVLNNRQRGQGRAASLLYVGCRCYDDMMNRDEAAKVLLMP
jgi:hypothetical protein